MVNYELDRGRIFPEQELPCSKDIIAQGHKLAKIWKVGHSEFLTANNCSSESEYKRRRMNSSKLMQHAHVGFRDKSKSFRAVSEIYESTMARGVTVDRYGICLDWSMGFPQEIRKNQLQGTGLVLDDPDDFSRLCNVAPVACHFGDFVLGFPGALENTQAALSAGSTIIGNLGQYFSFNLPGWSDDIQTTRATLTAIALMAKQPQEILVHSNLDDGFAGVFSDLSCALGAAMVEGYLVEDLMGAKITHCYGHHYSTPLLRFAFQQALSQVSTNPGSMIFGNTARYQGNEAENYASLSGYLAVDIAAQKSNPSGHAINPVPVTENLRIPDVAEIIDAQLFAHRLIEVNDGYGTLVDPEQVSNLVDELIAGAKTFQSNLMSEFENAGIKIDDAFEMFLAIRRIGGKRLEALFGPGKVDRNSGSRTAIVLSDTVREIQSAVLNQVSLLNAYGADKLKHNTLQVVVASTDVHEHGKMLVEGVFRELKIQTIDGGISVDPDKLALIAESNNADAIALTTHNGVALTYFDQLKDQLDEIGLGIPVIMGGQLNEIPDDSESSLPTDVSPQLEKLGAIVCKDIHAAMPCLIELSENKMQLRSRN